MKRFLILLVTLFCGVANADTINLHWLNEDGSTYQNSTCVIDSDLILPSTPPTKYGYTFTGWKMTRYTPIEYLEATGTQIIDTKIHPKDTLKIITKLIPETQDFLLFGARTSEVQSLLATFSREQGMILDYGSGSKYNRISYQGWSPNTIYNLVYGNRYIKDLYTNDFFASDSAVVFSEFNLNIYLFGLNINGVYTPTDRRGKVYYFQIYDNDTLVRDFIPVLDGDGTPCMYDKVTKQFFYNQGTGEFIAGPNV